MANAPYAGATNAQRMSTAVIKNAKAYKVKLCWKFDLIEANPFYRRYEGHEGLGEAGDF